MDRIPDFKVSIRWFIFLIFCLSKPQLGCRVLPHLECLSKYSELFGHRQILPFVHKVRERRLAPCPGVSPTLDYSGTTDIRDCAAWFFHFG